MKTIINNIYKNNNNVQIFNNEVFGAIRTMTNAEGETFFVGRDVAKALGYSNTRDALNRHVDQEDRDGVVIHDAIGRQQKAVIINESGLYALILSSQLEQARAFKRWVTSEVLPQIRRTGRYEMTARLHVLEACVNQLEETHAVLKPKAEFFDAVLCSEDTLTVTQMAQDYGVGAVRFNRLLEALCIQHRVGGQWVLFAPHQGRGYVHSYTTYHTSSHDGYIRTQLFTRWTQLGRHFIYERLRQEGILPNTLKAPRQIIALIKQRPTPNLARPQQRSSASVAQDGLTFSQPVDSFATRKGGGCQRESAPLLPVAPGDLRLWLRNARVGSLVAEHAPLPDSLHACGDGNAQVAELLVEDIGMR